MDPGRSNEEMIAGVIGVEPAAGAEVFEVAFGQFWHGRLCGRKNEKSSCTGRDMVVKEGGV